MLGRRSGDSAPGADERQHHRRPRLGLQRGARAAGPRRTGVVATRRGAGGNATTRRHGPAHLHAESKPKELTTESQRTQRKNTEQNKKNANDSRHSLHFLFLFLLCVFTVFSVTLWLVFFSSHAACRAAVLVS